jgi:hypothetical protein
MGLLTFWKNGKRFMIATGSAPHWASQGKIDVTGACHVADQKACGGKALAHWMNSKCPHNAGLSGRKYASNLDEITTASVAGW